MSLFPSKSAAMSAVKPAANSAGTSTASAAKTSGKAVAKEPPPYKRPSITGWLSPLLLGPWAAIFGSVAAYAYIGPEWTYVPRAVVLGVGLLLGCVVGSLYVAALALTDVALLAVRLRTFATGARGWASAALSPFAFMASYAVIQPWKFWKGGPWAVVAAVVAPVLLTALVTRMVFGAPVQKADKK